MTNDELGDERGVRVRHSFELRHSDFVIFLSCVALVLILPLSGCSSLDSDTIGNSSTPGKTPVPGEVNPDAPDAAQSMRTSPGWNF